MRRSFPARFAFGESIRPQRKYCATTSGQLHRAIAVRSNDSDVMVVIVTTFWWSRGTPVGLPSALRLGISGCEGAATSTVSDYRCQIHDYVDGPWAGAQIRRFTKKFCR